MLQRPITTTLAAVISGVLFMAACGGDTTHDASPSSGSGNSGGGGSGNSGGGGSGNSGGGSGNSGGGGSGNAGGGGSGNAGGGGSSQPSNEWDEGIWEESTWGP